MAATWPIARRWGSTGWTSKYRAMTRSVRLIGPLAQIETREGSAPGRNAIRTASKRRTRRAWSPDSRVLCASAGLVHRDLLDRPLPRLLSQGDAEAGSVGQV